MLFLCLVIHKQHNKGENEMENEYTATEQKKPLEEGAHYGTVISHEKKTASKDGREFDLHEILIEPEGTDLCIGVGYGTYVTTESKLGMLLQRFGATITPGENYSPQRIIPLGTRVRFLAKHVQKGDKKYTEIDKDTVRPVDAAQKNI